MTLLIAVSDISSDAELIASARGLAAAAAWDVQIVHVHEEEALPEGHLPEAADAFVLLGDATERLLELVERIDVDCLALGLRTIVGPGVGHTAGALLARFSVPLLLVRPGMRPLRDLKRILVPHEGTPSAAPAMFYADRTLCSASHEIVLLHVATPAVKGEGGGAAAPRFLDQPQYEWAAWREEFMKRFSPCPQGCKHSLLLKSGEPTEVIEAEASSSATELIVLAWKGSFVAGHGRVVRELLETAPCPLLVVPADDSDSLLLPRCRRAD